MEIDELSVHKAILTKPELIESKLGIKLDKKTLPQHERHDSIQCEMPMREYILES